MTRRSEGFTLIEALVTLSISLVIFTAAMALLGVAFRSSYGVVERTDAMQRGRIALDQITRELRSQVCNVDGTLPIAGGATGTSVTFYADLSDGSVAPKRHTLTLDTAGNRITDAVDAGTPRVLLDRAYQAPATPFLSYWAYPDGQTGQRNPSLQLPVPLSTTDAGRVARIDVGFLVQPQGTRATDHGTTLQDRVAVRLADPNDDLGDDSTSQTPGPEC
jgi:type II secretory pathway pseudopilin PulG